MRKVLKLLCFIMMLILSSLVIAGCGDDGQANKAKKENKKQTTLTFSNKGMKDVDDVKLKVIDGKVLTLSNQNPYNLRGAKPNSKKPFTLMVYLCGSNLESEGGCATKDLKEMVASKYNGENLNVVILTGGTQKWRTKGIDNRSCNIYTLEGDTLVRQATLGANRLANVKTLSTFVNYATTIYPADKFGLVFWDHGGGPVWAYGSDELARKGEKSSLYIPELSLALANSNLSKKKAEFIGFDACLMATAETALYLQNYAKYLVASEEAEPGFGWDWRWLKTLSENVDKDILISLKEVVDRFIAHCESDAGFLSDAYDGTLSVTDLSKANQLATALNNMGSASNKIFTNQQRAVAFERGRAKTKSFGDMGEDSNFDLIDLGDYATKLSQVFPDQARDLKNAVAAAIVYEKHSSNVSRASGIATYSPYNASIQEARMTYREYGALYGNTAAISNHTAFLTRLGKCLVPMPSSNKKRANARAVKGGIEVALPAEDAAQVVDAKFVLWRELEANSDYFVRLLVDNNVKSKNETYDVDFSGKLMSFQDEFIYVREKGRNENGSIVTYDSPAYLNGQKVRVLIRKDEDNKEGKITGALRITDTENSKMPSKDIITIKKGDKLQFRYWANLWPKKGDEAKYAGQPTHKWVKGQEITVGDSLKLKYKPVGKELYLATFWITEMNANMEISNYYTQKYELRRK